jgi:hypothetical protein
MTRYSVGDHVNIRYGDHQGQKAIILKIQEGDAYRVKAEDGTILFFSSKGLAASAEAHTLIHSSLSGPLIGK